MALISLERWLDRFGEERPRGGALPARLTITVRAERRSSAADRRVREQRPPGGESRRSGAGSRRQ